MKKSILLGFVAALFMGQSAMAQSAQEITYVEDPAQGYLFNSFSSNWFVSAEGGINYYFNSNNTKRDFFDRFSPNAGLWVGKWFSPIVGLRAGFNFTQVKGLSNDGGVGYYGDFRDGNVDYAKYKRNEFGAHLQAMLNLTNWWCGYRPDRIYNSTVYFGGGAYWTTAYLDGEWKNAHNFNTSLRAGWINSFNVSKAVQLFLDVRFSTFDGPQETVKFEKKTVGDLQAYVGVTYNFNKRTWDAPVVPVCPEVPDCSAIEARLQAANARIADLERQLQDCLNRPVEKVECPAVPLTTIYYPIGKSSLSTREVNVLRAVASVMKESGKTYTLTGWADNYTGTDAINTRLRHARVNGVQRQLVRFGVAESQLNATVDNGNLTDLGEKAVQLDRAVTIVENK